jgi:hypothetical protein
MEDVDNLLILSLKEVPNVRNIEDISQLFDPETLIFTTICCLKFIDPELDLPTSVPASMASRYQICSKLTNLIKVHAT